MSDNEVNFEQRVQNAQDSVESFVRRRITGGDWARIIRMARKPSAEEFKRTSIVCGIGLFVLGAVGFATLLLMDNALPHVFQNWLNIPLR